MKRISAFFTVVLLAVLASGCQARGFAVRPYLQDPGQTAMTIMWTTDLPARVDLRYGAGEALNQSVKDCLVTKVDYAILPPGVKDKAQAVPATQYVYEARLTGLAPATVYRYQVTVGGESAGGTFRTSPARPEPFTFGVYGDTRTDHKMHKIVAEAMAAHNPAFILHTGDLVQSGPFAEWQANFFDPLVNVIGRIPMWPAIGNHEGDAAPYRQLFSLPGGERWYSFDYANAHFVCLLSNAGAKTMEEMLPWLEKDLAASKADWKVVYFHHPNYDVGAHHTEWGRTEVLPLFRKYGVDLVVAGHSHGYQRFRPMSVAGENGQHPITHVVAAGGGAPLGAIEDTPYLAAAAKEYNYVLVSIDGAKLSAKALTPDSKQLDAFEIVKTNGKLDPAYVASAMPELDFDKLHDLVFPSLRGIYLAEPPQPGKPVTVTVNVGAGELPMKFTLRLDGGGHYKMAPAKVEGSSPANGTTPVTVTISAKGLTEVSKNTLEPSVRFICDYEINGQKGSVFGSPLKTGTPPASQPAGRSSS